MSDCFATPWTVAHQSPLSLGFPRQEYWSRLMFPSPRNWTCVSCIDWRILYHWTTKEAQINYILQFKKKSGLENSLVVQWLGLHASTAGAQIQSLVGKLRSHKLHGAVSGGGGESGFIVSFFWNLENSPFFEILKVNFIWVLGYRKYHCF